MPGSQEIESIGIAYFLYSWRWVIRVILVLIAIVSLKSIITNGKFLVPSIVLLLALSIAFTFNFKLAADHMFLQTKNIVFKGKVGNLIGEDRLAICVDLNGEQKAYPIEFLAYHHQVKDIIGGKNIIVTYCSVCRTGRVFEPLVAGKSDEFHLVGMDHFNALFEDSRTHSWWRQATGEAITGPMKGKLLPEIESKQLSIKTCLSLYPGVKIMQGDKVFQAKYDPQAKFEKGRSQNNLTKTDKASWKNKSWVVGIELKGVSKAYDWNLLKKVRVINDNINGVNIVLILAPDNVSFVAFERPNNSAISLQNNTLVSNGTSYNMAGKTNEGAALKSIAVHQEFWHSWRSFHPQTLCY